MVDLSKFKKNLDVCSEKRCSECEYNDVSFLVCESKLLADVSDAMSKLVDLIPRCCGTCIGCEIESDLDSKCDSGYVFSLDRSKEYLKSKGVPIE